jgi:hypothetical protein
MIRNIGILCLSALLAASASVFAQKQVEQTVDAAQRWQNIMEYSCRNKTETVANFQARINVRLHNLGYQGWELVSVSSAPLPGEMDCLASAYKRPSN